MSSIPSTKEDIGFVEIINIRYADKKRIQEWLNVNRVQSPLRSSIMDSINSILQTTEKSQEEFSEDTKKASEAEVEGNGDGRVYSE